MLSSVLFDSPLARQLRRSAGGASAGSGAPPSAAVVVAHSAAPPPGRGPESPLAKFLIGAYLPLPNRAASACASVWASAAAAVPRAKLLQLLPLRAKSTP